MPVQAALAAGRDALYGLYDKEGLLRYICTDMEACMAYAELFDLPSVECSLMSIAEPGIQAIKDPQNLQNPARNNN